MSLIFGRIAKVTAYRGRAGTPGGFVASNPSFFEQLPNGIEITKLRIKAQVDKSSDKEPNTCKITIHNCNEQTRTFLEQKPTIVRLEAGYDGVLRQLFIGDIRTCYTDFTTSTPETHIQLADGDRAWRFAQVNKTYRKGTPVAVVLKDAAASLGLSVDARVLASKELQAQFAAGRTLSGATRDELSALLGEFGYNWSIQDGRLVILKDNETLPGEALLISADSGPMIGSPSFCAPDKPKKPTLVKVKSKLYPQITPGCRIAIRSRTIHESAFRVEKVTHEIDTREGPFDSAIEGKAA